MGARDEGNLDLVFLWHMHQPDYRDHASREFVLPWVYLHAIKDYTDMVAHLERHPAIRSVVNFVPVLLDQIEDYVDQYASGQFRDPLLRLLAQPKMDALSAEERRFLLDSCFRSNHVTMLQPFPRYKRLYDLYKSLENQGDAALSYLSGPYFADLVTWYHLVWMGETERRRNPLIAELLSKGEAFTAADRLGLHSLIGELITGLLPRYKALAAAGRIELSSTPNTHPLSPLLIDFKSAREAQADAALPGSQAYPGGRTRVQAHIDSAMQSHARRFGQSCVGMWPAEGAISTPFLKQLGSSGCHWAASSEAVLAHSLRKRGGELPARSDYLYRGWELEDAPDIVVFFRDERLSDLIGFEYTRWHGRDAASHFLAQLEAIRTEASGTGVPLVSVILDGENAWEYYPYNGYYFFEHLYTAMEQSATIRTTTFSEQLKDSQRPRGRLQGVAAGSWVYGTMSTWIGDKDKNRAWDLLCAAKQAYDLVMDSGRLDAQQRRTAEAQLAVCEGSDWFWWFGDYNPPQAVKQFDSLYRGNLRRIYQMLKLTPPVQLEEPIARGGGNAESGGTMRRAT